jgi:hypothetical protein
VSVRFTLVGPHQSTFFRCVEGGDFGVVRTNPSGQASCTYTGTIAGTDTITALADTNNDFTEDNGENSATATKTWGGPAGMATTLTLTPSVAANFVGLQHCVLAHAEDAGGAPVSGAEIVFVVSGPNAQQPPPIPTDGGGNALFCYTGTQAGTDTITAFADNDGDRIRDPGEPQETATKRWLATQPQITLSPPSASNQIRTPHTVTATVSDGTGPVAGVNVLFSVSGVNAAQFLRCEEDTDFDFFIRTDASGQADCTYRGSNAGLDNITALADTNNNGFQDNAENSATATKSWVTSAEVTDVTLMPQVAANIVGSQHCVSGTPDPEVEGAPIVFEVSGANVQAPRTEPAIWAPLPLHAIFCYTGTQAGTDTISAFADNNANGTRDAGEPQTTATKRWLATQPQITLEPASESNPVGTPHTVTATVTDGIAPIEGVNVLFSVSGPSGNTFIRCEEDTDFDFFIRTDASGQASCTYTGTQAGTDTITALADTNNNGFQDGGENSATATKTWGGPTGTIEVRKQLGPTDDPGRFDLRIAQGATTLDTAPGVGNLGTTGTNTLAAGTYQVSESAATGTSLSDYTSAIECRDGATIVATTTGAGPLDVTLAAGANVVCTITNVRRTPGGQPPDCTKVKAHPELLWPPNNKFRLVTLTGASDPDGDPITFMITGVTQDEPTGSTPDARRTSAPNQIKLRAERLGEGDGRVYRIAFTVTDSSGRACSGTVMVGVPHDRRQGSRPKDSGRIFDSFTASGNGRGHRDNNDNLNAKK